MNKTLKFIDTLIDEFGKEQARQEFVDDVMERLDSLADEYDKGEVFHLTADEILFDDNGEYGVLEFLGSLDINSLEDKLIQEVLNYLTETMEEDDDKYPEELLEKLFDDLVA